MIYEISHVTDYTYAVAAAEAYIEARLTAPDLPTQKIIKRKLVITPHTATSSYRDFFGNEVEFFSLPYRHRKLSIANQATIQTQKVELPEDILSASIQEARQILNSSLTDIFDYLQPTEVVRIGRDALQWSRRYLPGKITLRKGLEALNEAICDSFEYHKGATDNSTALSTIWKQKKGVCQDFAHVMLSILRTAGLPARYVCGYIDAHAESSVTGGRLVGALATHAWVEVLLPGQVWVALDPTNKQWCGEKHIAVSFGRDSRDAAPLRGTFKGSGGQNMKARVFVKRLPVLKPEARTADEGKLKRSKSEAATAAEKIVANIDKNP